MKLTIGIDGVNNYFYSILKEELSDYDNVNIMREGDEVIVQTEGEIVKCSCIVALCDKYRNTGNIGMEDN